MDVSMWPSSKGNWFRACVIAGIHDARDYKLRAALCGLPSDPAIIYANFKSLNRELAGDDE
jgi:hypothetical protein